MEEKLFIDLVESLKEAVDAAKSTTTPIQLIVANGAHYKVYSIDYHGGMRYPHLQRDKSSPDLLTEILQPLVK